MELGQVFFGHLVTLAKVMEISYARAVYDVARCAVAQLDRCDTGNCSNAIYRLPGGVLSCRGRGRGRWRGVGQRPDPQGRGRWRGVGQRPDPQGRGRGGGVGSVNAQTRKAEGEGGGVGSVNAQTRKAEGEGGGVGSVNAQTRKAEALAQMPCVSN
jgi:hypothetical protein